MLKKQKAYSKKNNATLFFLQIPEFCLTTHGKHFSSSSGGSANSYTTSHHRAKSDFDKKTNNPNKIIFKKINQVSAINTVGVKPFAYNSTNSQAKTINSAFLRHKLHVPTKYITQGATGITKHTNKSRSLVMKKGRPSSSSKNQYTFSIKRLDRVAAKKLGQLSLGRNNKPLLEKTHAFKNKRGPLMTKRNKRLSFFFRAARSLSSQLFAGFRTKELRTRRGRRHNKFSINVAKKKGLLDTWHRPVFYSIKNERVRWGYNLAKFKKKRIFYYKLSSRVFFRRYFGFSNHKKVGNFQIPFRKSPRGYFNFFSMYKYKPYTFIRSIRWLKSYFSFVNMRLGKYLTFVDYNNTATLFRSSDFWNKYTKPTRCNKGFQAQALFTLTQPVARTAHYSELDFFKKKMTTAFIERTRASRWYSLKKKNFYFTKIFKNTPVVVRKMLYKGITHVGVKKQERPHFLRLLLRRRLFKKLSHRLTSGCFVYFFRNLIYNTKKTFFALNVLLHKKTHSTKPSLISKFSSNFKNFFLNKKLNILDTTRAKLLILKNLNPEFVIKQTAAKLKKNKNINSFLFSRKLWPLDDRTLKTFILKKKHKRKKIAKLSGSFLIKTKHKWRSYYFGKQNKLKNARTRKTPLNFNKGYNHIQNPISLKTKQSDFFKRVKFLQVSHKISTSLFSQMWEQHEILKWRNITRSCTKFKKKIKRSDVVKNQFSRKLIFSNFLKSTLDDRKLLLSAKVLNVLDKLTAPLLKVNKRRFVQNNNVQGVEKYFGLTRTVFNNSRRAPGYVNPLKKFRQTLEDKILLRLGLYNARVLFKMTKPANPYIFKLLNDKRDTSINTLKFLFRVKGVYRKINENPLALSYNANSGVYFNKTDKMNTLSSRIINKKKFIPNKLRLSNNKPQKRVKFNAALRDPRRKRLMNYNSNMRNPKRAAYFFVYKRGDFNKYMRPLYSRRGRWSHPLKFFGRHVRIRKLIRPFKALHKKTSIVKRFWWRKWSKILRKPTNIRGIMKLKRPKVLHKLGSLFKTKIKPFKRLIQMGGRGKVKKPLYRRGWVYDLESHSYIRRNKIKSIKNYINAHTSLFTYKKYRSFLKQEKLAYLKKKMYESTMGSKKQQTFHKPVIRVREHFIFATLLRGFVLPFWLHLVKHTTRLSTISKTYTYLSKKNTFSGCPNSHFLGHAYFNFLCEDKKEYSNKCVSRLGVNSSKKDRFRAPNQLIFGLPKATLFNVWFFFISLSLFAWPSFRTMDLKSFLHLLYLLSLRSL